MSRNCYFWDKRKRQHPDQGRRLILTRTSLIGSEKAQTDGGSFSSVMNCCMAGERTLFFL